MELESLTKVSTTTLTQIHQLMQLLPTIHLTIRGLD